MKKAWAIAWKDICGIVKDYKAFVLIILMPFVLIVILGFLFSPVFTRSDKDSSVIAVVDNANDEDSQSFYTELSKSIAADKSMACVKLNQNQAAERMQNDTATAVVLIHDKTDAGSSTSIYIIKNPNQERKAYLAAQSVQVAIQKQSAAKTAKILGGSEAAKYLQILNGGSQINVHNRATKSADSTQYYSAAMIAMFILYIAQMGAKSITNDKADKTYDRILASSTDEVSYIFGKFIGIFLIAMLQLAILILLTHFVLGADWGGLSAGIPLLVVASSFAVGGLGCFIGSLAKSTESAQMISNILIFGMSTLGGSFIPISSSAPALKILSNFTINKWIIDGFISVINFSSITVIAPSLAVLAAIGLICLCVNIVLLKHREVQI